MLRRLALLAALFLAAPACGAPVVADAKARSDGSAPGTCGVCATADTCCAAHTDNPVGNCQLHAACVMFTGAERASVEDGCAYYLRVASTPPAPAACGPHPAAD